MTMVVTSFVSHLPMQAVLGKKLRGCEVHDCSKGRHGKTLNSAEITQVTWVILKDTYGISSHLEEIKDFQVALMELCCGWRQSALEPKCSCFVEAKGWFVLEGHGQIAVQSSMWTLVG